MRKRKLPPGDVHIGARVKTELYQGLKIRAVLAEVPIRALLEEAVADYLAKHPTHKMEQWPAE